MRVIDVGAVAPAALPIGHYPVQISVPGELLSYGEKRDEESERNKEECERSEFVLSM